jgi:hypothetical protein
MQSIRTDDFPIDPYSIGGTELVARINRLSEDVHKQFASATRPPTLTAGGLWVREDASGASLVLFDGTADAVVGSWSDTGAGGIGLHGETIAPIHDPARAYARGDVIWVPSAEAFFSANADIPAGPYDPSGWGQLSNLRQAGVIPGVSYDPNLFGRELNPIAWPMSAAASRNFTNIVVPMIEWMFMPAIKKVLVWWEMYYNILRPADGGFITVRIPDMTAKIGKDISWPYSGQWPFNYTSDEALVSAWSNAGGSVGNSVYFAEYAAEYPPGTTNPAPFVASAYVVPQRSAGRKSSICGVLLTTTP